MLDVIRGYCQLEPILAPLDGRPRKKTPEYRHFPSCGSHVLPQISLKLTIPVGVPSRGSAARPFQGGSPHGPRNGGVAFISQFYVEPRCPSPNAAIVGPHIPVSTV